MAGNVQGVDKGSTEATVAPIVRPETVIKVDEEKDGHPANGLNEPGAERLDADASDAPSASRPGTAPVGRLRRTPGLSVKTSQPVPAAVESVPQDAPPVTQQQLEEYWGDMLEAMKDEFPKLAEQLAGRELRMEEEDLFVVVVNNSYLDAEIRPRLLRMLTYLRKRSRRPKLNCRVEVVYEEHEAVAYAPRDKYDAMVQKNPHLERFRELFPELDY